MTRGFRGPLPLRDRDFAEIRARVMLKIGRRPVIPVALRLTFAAVAVAALVFVLMPRRSPLPSAPPILAVQRPVAVPLSGSVPGHSTPKAPPAIPKPVVVASTGAPPSASDMHIEIQTADPNVRIIWIAR